MLGIDEVEMAQAHGLHRPSRRTDVARMGGMAEDDSDVFERIRFIQNAIPTKIRTGYFNYEL